jgi:intracellular chloride channel protein
MSEEVPEHDIVLFVKAGSDRECLGCCPFSQRLFMLLWLKGSVFNVTTVDKTSKPKELADIAPGTNPPFLLFDGEVLTDVPKIEDFLESTLTTPKYPILKEIHPESSLAGNDVFAKFSAWIKCSPEHPNFQTLQQRYVQSLSKLDSFLKTKLDDQTDSRLFIDSNRMTLADCNLLPKLHIAITASKMRRNFQLPENFDGINKYLNNAASCDEFGQTCCDDGEISWTYGGPKPKPNKLS